MNANLQEGLNLEYHIDIVILITSVDCKIFIFVITCNELNFLIMRLICHYEEYSDEVIPFFGHLFRFLCFRVCPE